MCIIFLSPNQKRIGKNYLKIFLREYLIMNMLLKIIKLKKSSVKLVLIRIVKIVI